MKSQSVLLIENFSLFPVDKGKIKFFSIPLHSTGNHYILIDIIHMWNLTVIKK